MKIIEAITRIYAKILKKGNVTPEELARLLEKFFPESVNILKAEERLKNSSSEAFKETLYNSLPG